MELETCMIDMTLMVVAFVNDEGVVDLVLYWIILYLQNGDNLE